MRAAMPLHVIRIIKIQITPKMMLSKRSSFGFNATDRKIMTLGIAIMIEVPNKTS